MIKREVLPRILKLLDRPEILVLRGARRTGKTTLLEYIREFLVKEKGVPDKAVRFISFEDPEMREQFSRNPVELMNYFFRTGKVEKLYVLLDEVQYVKDSGHLLKWVYDEFKGRVKLVVTGSSSLEIRQDTTKFLVGRAFLIELYPFSFREFLSARDAELYEYYSPRFQPVAEMLEGSISVEAGKELLFWDRMCGYYQEYCLWGGYPEVVLEDDLEIRREILKNIYMTYINRDIIEFLRMKNLDRFRRVVISLASNTGGITNFSSLSTDTGSYLQELKHFLQVLEETYVIKAVSPFFRNVATEIRKAPKVYFLDNGLRNYIIKNFNPFQLREDVGELVESAVMKRFLMADMGFNFWRTTGKAEVDFVLMEGGRIIPIEVKYRKKARTLGRGYRNFLDKYQLKYGIVATRELRHRTEESNFNIEYIPAVFLS